MNDGLRMWIDGWKVIWRLLVFKFIILLFMSPLIIFHRLVFNALEKDRNAMGLMVYMVYALVVGVVVAPFIYYAASRLRGEFIYPRYMARRVEEKEEAYPVEPAAE